MPKFLGPVNCFDSEGWLSCDQLTFYVFHVFLVKGMQHLSEKIKVRTDSSTEFGSDPILIDRIRIESAAGSNPILIRTAVDRAVDFNERVTVFTTGRACAPISDINGGNADIQLRCAPAYN